MVFPLALAAQQSPIRPGTRTNETPPAVRIQPHVVSVSKQITAFADDQGLAAALAAFGDKVKGKLLTRLAVRDAWKHPVLVVVRVQPGDQKRVGEAITSRVFRTERGLKYQIDCLTPPPLIQEDLVRELVRVLCSELANRGPARPAVEEIAIPPLWFTEGLTQNLLAEVRSIELELVERSIEKSLGSDLKAIFAAEELPPAGAERQFFRVKCKLLIRALATLRDGQRRAQRFLTSLQPGVSWREAFRDCYGDVLTDLETSEAWWKAQLHQRSSPSPLNRLSAAETDERLSRLLTCQAVHRDHATSRDVVRDVTLPQLKTYIHEPTTLAMVKGRIAELEKLQLIAHQSYQPVLTSYVEALNHVTQERFRKLGAALRAAEQSLQQTRAHNAQISASLDKLEAEQVNNELLFLYNDYFQTFDQLKTIERNRDTAIKEYLDRFQVNDGAKSAIQ